jgi:TetR/AcrR family transcriptional repressor of nem operon
MHLPRAPNPVWARFTSLPRPSRRPLSDRWNWNFVVRPSVRSMIHDAAMKVFTERGFYGSSVQDITDTAGVPKGSFYNHFKSKEALAAEILTAYGEGTTDRGILIDTDVPPRVRLEKHFAALNAYFSVCTDGCLIGKFMAEVSGETPEIRVRLVEVLDRWGEQLSSAIADGQRDGSIRKDLKPDELAAFLIDSYEGAILRTRVEENPRALRSFSEIVFSTILT